MSEQKQVTPEELEALRSLQRDYYALINKLGGLELNVLDTKKLLNSLESQKEETLKDIDTLSEKEKQLVVSLREKYGNVEIDPNTGNIILPQA